jgi:tetratricopeptide (TPR) repeat protein
VLYSDKDPEGALEAASAALRNDRNLTQAEFIRSNALIDLKRYDDALTALDTVDRTNPMLGANNTRALRARIHYKQRKFGQSYREFRELQSLNPRLRILAPVLAAVSMVAVGQFGQNAQFFIIGLVTVLAVLILFGLSLIPVAGPWIVTVLVLGLIGLFAFGALRQSQGAILGAAPGGRIGSLGIAVVAFAAIFVLVLYLGSHTVHWSFTSTWLGVAGAAGLIFSAAILYLFGRFGGQRMGAAA